MSFFTRTAIVLALVAGVAHVFRRDIVRIIGAVRAPAATFLRDVKKELDVPAPPPAPPSPDSSKESASAPPQKLH